MWNINNYPLVFSPHARTVDDARGLVLATWPDARPSAEEIMSPHPASSNNISLVRRMGLRDKQMRRTPA
ncbi:unnamed protein product, partial [Iphiclides podalirius]